MKYFQAAKEINPGYSTVQSYLTFVLLGCSVIALILTILLLIPLKNLRSTRSVKINICLTVALLLASSLFLLQDAFVNVEDAGLIKLVSSDTLFFTDDYGIWMLRVISCFIMIVEICIFLNHHTICFAPFRSQ